MSQPPLFHLFVYGSLRSGFHNPMYEYISNFFTLVGNAKVKGKLYNMGSYPAGIASNDDSFIIGELYRANNPNEFSWAIGQLDDYEGVNVESDEVQLYRREIADVYCNETITASWVYWFNGSVDGKTLITSGDMMEYIDKNK